MNRDADGSVIWTDHGPRCGVIMQIAVQSGQLKRKGGYVLRRSENLLTSDETYKTGFGKPPDTPKPPM